MNGLATGAAAFARAHFLARLSRLVLVSSTSLRIYCISLLLGLSCSGALAADSAFDVALTTAFGAGCTKEGLNN